MLKRNQTKILEIKKFKVRQIEHTTEILNRPREAEEKISDRR